MTLQSQFILRHKADGHVRFQIPAQFCEATLAKSLTAALLNIDGIYRVQVYRNQRKLSIRYQETVCDFKTLAQQLFRLINQLHSATDTQSPSPKAPALARLKNTVSNFAPSRWLKQKMDEAQETVEAAKVLAKGLQKSKTIIDNPERFLTDFFNDVLALYLIKLHWEQITKQWIPNPIKHRYEWLAASYMLYLLIRSRNPKN